MNKRVLLLLALASPLAAQAPPPAFKGIWEPVSFTEDIGLRSVFFVTVNTGWAAGEKGTIIHTRDGGATWTAQLGGDPQAAEKDIKYITFLDERTGWAIKDDRVLRTTDGESWEDLGKGPSAMWNLVMSTPTEGVASGDVGMGSVPSTLFKTRDGGKTWQPVTLCQVKAMVQGITRELTCRVHRIQFVSATHGWLVAYTPCIGAGCGPPPILGKTEDGGDSWTFILGGGEPEVVGATDFYFTSETKGFVRLTDDKLALTTDAGQSWKGLIASVRGPTWKSKLLFADPEVGWALDEQKLSYTTDGGTRWNSRAIQFPANFRDWSFPRRDRAYAVGDHGMVFRYSVVPAAQAVKPGTIVGPAMPAFASPLDDEVAKVEATVAEVSAGLSGAATGSGGAAAAGADSLSGFSAGCCKTSLNKFHLILGAIAQQLPAFLSKYKNTNLLGAAIRMLTELPGKFGELRGAVTAFRQAQDKGAAQAALEQIKAAAQALQQSTKAAFQQETP